MQGSFGYTFWARTGTSKTPFVSRETTLSKTSGDGTAGYGIIGSEGMYLKKGLNQSNTVKVTLSSGIFTLYLNGES